MADNYVLGKDCVLYFGSDLLDGGATTPTTNTWTELDNAKNVDLAGSTDECDITTRANAGWKGTAVTLKDAGLDFEMLWLPDDAGFAAIQAAWAAAGEIAMMALDGSKDVSDSQGLASNFVVTNFSRSEPLREAVTVKVTLKPSSHTEWYQVA